MGIESILFNIFFAGSGLFITHVGCSRRYVAYIADIELELHLATTQVCSCMVPEVKVRSSH